MVFITDVSKTTNKVNKPTKRVINKTNYNKRHRYEREDKTVVGKELHPQFLLTLAKETFLFSPGTYKKYTKRKPCLYPPKSV